jgi:hypothetical protein
VCQGICTTGTFGAAEFDRFELLSCVNMSRVAVLSPWALKSILDHDRLSFPYDENPATGVLKILVNKCPPFGRALRHAQPDPKYGSNLDY